MSVQSLPGNDFLFLNSTLCDALDFAKTSQCFKPQPGTDLIEEFEAAFKELLINSQEILLLPASNTKMKLEAISGAYTVTYRGLTALYMSAPAPEDAAGLFDYQKEQHARQRFLTDIQILLNWHSDFFDKIVSSFPFLPIPFPFVQSKKDNKAQHSNPGSQPDVDIESVANDGSGDENLPEIFLE